MSEVLVIFSLGPVQSFIAEARRTRDLWAGSSLLSDATRAAITAFREAGAQVIYPADPARRSLPNKFVVRMSADRVWQAAQAAQEAARRKLEEIALGARRYLEKKGASIDETWVGIWKRQLRHHLEFFWAAVEIKGNYRDAYGQASLAFEAAKRTRVFEQCEEEGPKDSLSGRRSALHTRGVHPRDYWAKVSEALTPADLRPGGRERLDALGMTKRFGYGDVSFPSTSTIATIPFLEKARGTRALKRYLLVIQGIPPFFKVSSDPDWPYDGDLLFPEALHPNRLRNDYRFTDEDLEKYRGSLEAARLALEMLYEAVKARPSPYYAILAMDGDSMGEHVARCASAEEHVELSTRLVKFAELAEGIITARKGTPVYLGGDDVLALFPLSTAVQAASELAHTYRRLFADWAEKYPHHLLPFTASAGIAIAHHRYPLGAALRAAREAERKAKSVKGKDTVAVAVLRRSGERVEMRSPWKALGDRFEELCRWFGTGAISSRFAYDVADVAQRLGNPEGLPQTNLIEPFRAELKRLLRRHRDEHKPRPPDPERAADDLAEWAEVLPGGFEELANWILLARFVAQGGEV